MKKTFLPIALLLCLMQFAGAQTNYLWATATQGGAYGFGTIVRGDSDGTNFQTVASFDSLNGAYPIGKMVKAGNGKLYGVTLLGTTGDSCCIYRYDPTANTLTAVYQFALHQYGVVPSAGLIVAAAGKLYGTTITGGLFGYGAIYSFDVNTNTYTDVYDFNDTTGTGVNVASELFQANDGKLYAVAQFGGLNNSAVLFSFNPADSAYNVLHTFGVFSQPNYANRFPAVIQASDNKIYGVLGLYDTLGRNSGILFSYDPVYSVYTDVHDFDTLEGFPEGGLVEAGNGKIYGTTQQFANGGWLFSYDITGSVFDKPHSLLSGVPGSYITGLGAFGPGQLTGAFMQGGAYGGGSLFTYDVTANSFTDIFDFTDSTTGAYPICDILKAAVQTPAGIINVQSTDMVVFPNPAANMLQVQNATPGTPYTIINTLGQVLDRGILNGGPQLINVAQLPAGVYLLNGVMFVKG